MITTRVNEAPIADEEIAPPLGDLLLRSATSLREQTAVRALVEEEHLLARDNIRTAFIVKTDGGTMGCDWELLSNRLYTLGFDDAERAFIDLVLSLTGPHQTSLTRVLDLDERRLAILLRAMVQLSGCDTIAVGTRI